MQWRESSRIGLVGGPILPGGPIRFEIRIEEHLQRQANHELAQLILQSSEPPTITKSLGPAQPTGSKDLCSGSKGDSNIAYVHGVDVGAHSHVEWRSQGICLGVGVSAAVKEQLDNFVPALSCRIMQHREAGVVPNIHQALFILLFRLALCGQKRSRGGQIKNVTALLWLVSSAAFFTVGQHQPWLDNIPNSMQTTVRVIRERTRTFEQSKQPSICRAMPMIRPRYCSWTQR